MLRPAVPLALALALGACRAKSSSPRPVASTTPGPAPRPLCADGGGTVTDPKLAPWFPRVLDGYCIDPNADQRQFGGHGDVPLADASELMGLSPEAMQRADLRSIATLTYVREGAEPGRVAVHALSFTTVDTAYAFFTDRIGDAVAGGRALVPFAAGASAVLGDARAWLVRGPVVVRFDFSNHRLPPARAVASAAPVLRALARAVGDRLPGAARIPPAAELLPADGRVPLSLRYDAADLGGFLGVGSGAIATYANGGDRYRMALAVRIDTDAAEDVLSTLKKRAGSRHLKGGPYDALRVAEVEPKTGEVHEWIFGRKGALVAGVALDAPPRAAPKGEPPERARAVLKMKRVLDRLPARVAW